MRLGVDYYPHYFEDSNIENELDNIKMMHANSIRIGDFAWQFIEKVEGHYDFSYFNNLIKISKSKQLDVMVCTPTSSFPAWLAKKHSEIMIVDENLNQVTYGGRREYCYNSDIYCKYAKNITKQTILNFRDYDNVTTFQIDNELGHENSDYCYCENCLNKFRNYLKDKFKDIENLNEALGLVFWSKSYNTFDEIEIPRKTVTYHNPSLLLEWDRFRSYSINKFGKMLADVVKKYKYEHQKITHNFYPGFFNVCFDQNELCKSLDFTSYDNYPVWGGLSKPVEPAEISLNLDYVRGLKNQNFWITEQIMGSQGHDITGYLPRSNQSKMWSYHAFAHGCENMYYFSYRSAHKGQEQFCKGIIDHDNKLTNRYYEAQTLFADITKYQRYLTSKIKSKIAIVYDFDNIFHWKRQKQSDNFNYMEEILRFYRAFYNLNQPIDIISSDNDFNNYKIIILPVMQIFDNELKTKLEQFTKNKNIVIFTYRSGIKDKNANIYLGKTFPSLIKDMAGVSIIDTEALHYNQSVAIIKDEATRNIDTMREILKLDSASPYAVYNDTDFYGKVAISVNNYQNAKIYYVGCGIDKRTASEIAKECLDFLSIIYIETQDNLEIIKRGDNDELTFYINHSNQKITYKDLEIRPFEVIINDIN
ncbi:MAG: beta-galactosidase [Bacilli bacterium]